MSDPDDDHVWSFTYVGSSFDISEGTTDAYPVVLDAEVTLEVAVDPAMPAPMGKYDLPYLVEITNAEVAMGQQGARLNQVLCDDDTGTETVPLGDRVQVTTCLKASGGPGLADSEWQIRLTAHRLPTHSSLNYHAWLAASD